MRRIALLVALLAAVLTGALALLVGRALQSVEREQSMRHEVLAERVFDELEEELTALIDAEEARPFLQYRFFYVPEGQVPGTAGLSRSPLSEVPGETFLLGWFQVDPDGAITTPLLPDDPDFAQDSVGWSDDAAVRARAERIVRAAEGLGVPRTAGEDDEDGLVAAEPPAQWPTQADGLGGLEKRFEATRAEPQAATREAGDKEGLERADKRDDTSVPLARSSASPASTAAVAKEGAVEAKKTKDSGGDPYGIGSLNTGASKRGERQQKVTKASAENVRSYQFPEENEQIVKGNALPEVEFDQRPAEESRRGALDGLRDLVLGEGRRDEGPVASLDAEAGAGGGAATTHAPSDAGRRDGGDALADDWSGEAEDAELAAALQEAEALAEEAALEPAAIEEKVRPSRPARSGPAPRSPPSPRAGAASSAPPPPAAPADPADKAPAPSPVFAPDDEAEKTARRDAQGIDGPKQEAVVAESANAVVAGSDATGARGPASAGESETAGGRTVPVPRAATTPARPTAARVPSYRPAVPAAVVAPPTEVDVEVSPLRGRLADAETLLLVRTVRIGDQEYVQGLALALPLLQRWLEERVLAASELRPFLALRWGEEVGADGLLAPGVDFAFRHAFAEPFGALTTTALLRALPEPRGSGRAVILQLAALLVVVGALGILALGRMVAVVVQFAERRQNFVAAVSHELKTPLTAIRMYAEMLRDGYVQTDAKRTEYYATMSAESERLSRLIQNVLELSRLENDGRRGAGEVVVGAVGPVLAEAARVLERHATEQRFRLVVDSPDGLPPVRFERDGLLQVLINLLDNGIKFSAGAAVREVRVEARAEDGGVVLRVRDHGPGVPAAQLRHIFEPFYRGERELTRTTKGTGIGLALVQGIVQRMGGRVAARNHPEGGFEVRVVLAGA